ncbi:MAG: bifunctional phosphopantothenoylcysteine decarboxylase/phosphopantothenate--cysteine ligase CoaBC [Deltaproteobacteria bacterium]|nr:bifunctional phosphopantothenoylcysteine decarboxylase/phosphopantothenate--cysteine ligase CoaBC [Deltaproteobacteria bacterium]
MVLKDKKIVLGVTGGIAAYKACELARMLKKEGAFVRCVMTDAARKFITPLSLETLSCNPVSYDLFPAAGGGGINHIDLAQSDLIVIAPATANIIGKLAGGIADDLLTTVVMASKAPVLLAPAMNEWMYENPAVAENIERLKKRGFRFVGPESGELACGREGTGRLAELEDIVEAMREALSKRDMAAEKVLVTAGATREALDPVRFLSNASSGRMGYSMARAARRRGAEVVLVSGHSVLPEPPGVSVVRVVSAEEMMEAAIRYFPQSTVVIMAAAVSDFRPVKAHAKKMKKAEAVLTAALERTPDILKEMGKKRKGQFLVGFALETEDLVKNASAKLKEKNLDMVVANSPAGFDSETNEVTIIDRGGKVDVLLPMGKGEIAERILDRVVSMKAR